jgi:hypothetical protein
MGVEPITPILQGSVAASGMEARVRESVIRVTRVGVEPTGTRLSTSPLYQFAYPAFYLLFTFHFLLSSPVARGNPVPAAGESREWRVESRVLDKLFSA